MRSCAGGHLELSTTSDWQVRRYISFQRFIRYIAENETHPLLKYITLLRRLLLSSKKAFFSAKKSMCEIIVYLPRGWVLSGFCKSIETPETKTISDVCKMLIKQPPAAAWYGAEMPYVHFYWRESLLPRKTRSSIQGINIWFCGSVFYFKQEIDLKALC